MNTAENFGTTYLHPKSENTCIFSFYCSCSIELTKTGNTWSITAVVASMIHFPKIIGIIFYRKKDQTWGGLAQDHTSNQIFSAPLPIIIDDN